MAYPARYFKQKNFTRAVIGSGAALADVAVPLDGELANIATTLQQMNDVLRGITTADGRLKNLSTALAQALAGTERFSATASQTAFTTTITWDSSFDPLNVAVFVNGTKVDTNSVTVADSGGYLQVTLAAQSLGAIVLVMAYSAGAGVLTRLASAANSDGASLVSIEDIANLYVSSNAEDAFAEIMTSLNDFIADIGSLTGVIFADGRNDFTDDQDMGGNKITGLADGAADTDAVTYGQISAYIDIWNDLASQFLALTGTGSGAMTGPIEMGDNAITGLADGVDPQDAATVAQVDAAVAASTSTNQPIGSVFDFAGAAIPTGFLECNGDAVSRATYANLFAVLGTTWGAGDAVSTFNVPDLRGRFTMGAGTGPTTGEGSVPGTARTLASVGGFETQTLTVAQIPLHEHATYIGDSFGGGPPWGSAGTDRVGGPGATSTFPVSAGSSGGGGSHPIMNPFTVMKKIIKY